MRKRLIVGISVSVVATIVGVSHTIASYAQQTGQVPFEALSYCGQLDAIARGGKSVAGFIADSADKEGYLWAVQTQCNWHSEQAAQVGQPETDAQFAALSYCDQMDALGRAGKSIADFIVSTADPNGYIWAGRSQCSWHSDQTDVADAILNPPISEPVVASTPTFQAQEASYPSFQRSASSRASAPRFVPNSYVSEPPSYNYESDF